MKSLNRSVAIITAKQPYVDWANSFDDGVPKLSLEDTQKNTTAYLIDEAESPKIFQKFIEKHYIKIFNNELDAWMSDSKTWPQKRTLEMFKEWFDVKICEIVYDLGKGHVEVWED